MFDSREKRDRYVAYRNRFMVGTADGSKVFKKYFDRVYQFASYYARGGTEYLRDRDLDHINYSGLKPIPRMTTFSSFEDLSRKAHELNWILIRGKHFNLPAH